MCKNVSSPVLHVQTLELMLQSCSLFCIDVSSRSSSWAAPSVVDLPGSHLIRAGYSLIASEPCLTLSFSLGNKEEGVLLLELWLQACCSAYLQATTHCLRRSIAIHSFC